MSEPLVSVIIPVFNAQAFIRETLESILAQSYKSLEIIVVDDGSTDDSAVTIASYKPKVRYVYQPSTRNAAIPRNVGLQYCQGDLITFFDADDIMLEDKIEKQVDFLRRHPDVSMILTDYVNFTVNSNAKQTHFETCQDLYAFLQRASSSQECILQPEQARSFLTKENFSIADSPLLRKELIQKTGAFDEHTTPSEDFEFVYRTALDHPIGLLNRIGFKRRLHEHNTTRDIKRVLAGQISSRKKLLNLETSPELQRQLRAYIADRYCDWCELSIGVNNKLAFSNLLASQCFRLRGSSRAYRLLLKLILSLIGVSFSNLHSSEREHLKP